MEVGPQRNNKIVDTIGGVVSSQNNAPVGPVVIFSCSKSTVIAYLPEKKETGVSNRHIT